MWATSRGFADAQAELDTAEDDWKQIGPKKRVLQKLAAKADMRKLVSAARFILGFSSGGRGSKFRYISKRISL